jgi:hypothetical protein
MANVLFQTGNFLGISGRARCWKSFPRVGCFSDSVSHPVFILVHPNQQYLSTRVLEIPESAQSQSQFTRTQRADSGLVENETQNQSLTADFATTLLSIPAPASFFLP